MGKVPLLTPYGKANVQLKSGESISHSDCGEHITAYLIGLGLYDPETGRYNPEFWRRKVETFDLHPHTRHPNDRLGPVFRYFSGSDGLGRKSKYDSRQFSHDEWGSNVMAYLNEPSLNGDDPMGREPIQYTKPKEAVCEMNPGIDNTLLLLERLLGDSSKAVQPSPDDSISKDGNPTPNLKKQLEESAVFSLSTLSRMEAERLKDLPEEAERTKALFRKWKFFRFFKIISPDPAQPIRYYSMTRDKELPDNFEVLTFSVPTVGGKFTWTLGEKHFALSKDAEDKYDWKRRHSRWIFKELLKDIKEHPSSLGNLHQFLTLDDLPQDPEVIEEFETTPSLSTPFL